MAHVFITGSAGFIGYHLANHLLDLGHRVTGYDAMTEYYDTRLKEARHERLAARQGFAAHHGPAHRLEDAPHLAAILAAAAPDSVVHLAAQAGVRYSLEAPRAYLDANITGTYNLLEAALGLPRRPDHLLLASTSSAYGANTKMPYAETDKADTQMSFYAATKKAGESMAHALAHLNGLPVTMFRFFTVYGPWGRPDMALFKFTRAILQDQPIDLYNHGRMVRDFTYIDDLTAGIAALIDVPPPQPGDRGPALPDDSLSPVAPFRVVNIGNGQKVELLEFVAAIEAALGRKARRNPMPMQPGDVPATWADCHLLEALTGHRPATPVAEGVAAFTAWYREYYGA